MRRKAKGRENAGKEMGSKEEQVKGRGTSQGETSARLEKERKESLLRLSEVYHSSTQHGASVAHSGRSLLLLAMS